MFIEPGTKLLEKLLDIPMYALEADENESKVKKFAKECIDDGLVT